MTGPLEAKALDRRLLTIPLLLGLACAFAAGCRTPSSASRTPSPPPKPAGAATSVEDQLRRASADFEAGKLAEAERRLGDLLAVAPDHLEGWVLRAMVDGRGPRPSRPAAAGDGGGAALSPWQRVERILVFEGKLRPFLLPSTLYHAARHFLELDRRPRAELFVEELMRRFPGSEWSGRLWLLQAERAMKRRRWGVVVLACGNLARLGGSSPGLARCRTLAQRARQLIAVGPEPAAGARHWSWETPRPTGNALRDVWVGAKGEVFAVGAAGTLLRSKGGRFVVLESPTRWDLLALCGRDARQLYAVGRGGVVLGYHQERWRLLRGPDPALADLRAAHVAPDGRLVAVGDGGTVVERGPGPDASRPDASRPVASGPVASGPVASGPGASGPGASGPGASGFVTHSVGRADLRGVWGADDGAIYAVGDEGTLLRRQGAGSWRRIKSDSYEDLWSVHGRSSRDVLAVGTKRTVVYIDGEAAKEDVIGLVDLRGIWAGPAGKAWAVGRDGAIVHGQSKRWRTRRNKTLVDLNAISGGPGGRELWAVGDGGTIMRARAARWRIVAGGMRQDLIAVSATARPPLALGERGALLSRGRGGRWSRAALPVDGRYRGLWSDGARLAAVGERGLIVVREGSAYRRLASGTAEDLNAVWGRAGGLVGVGSRGTVLRVVGKQGELRVVSDRSPVGLDLRGVHGVDLGARSRVLAVGVKGAILAFDGQRWQEERSGTLAALNAVWVGRQLEVAVGERGTIVERRVVSGGAGREGRWQVRRGPTAQDLVAVWGENGRSVYAISRRGTVIHYDGRRWSVQRSPASCLRAVSGAPNVGVLAVGCHGSVLRLGEVSSK